MPQRQAPRRSNPGDAPFVVRKAGQTTVIELIENSLVNRSDLERVCEALDRLIEQSPTPRFVLSFEQVTYLSSVFLGKLIAFNKKIKAKGGELSLININPRIREVFSLTKLDTQIPIRETRGGGPGRRAWATLFTAACASAAVGLFFLGWVLINGGTPDRQAAWADRVAAVTIYYFIASIVLAPLVYFGRRWLMRQGSTLQWSAAGAVIAVTLTMFAAFLMAR